MSYEYLLNILYYNPDTGDWVWLVDRNNKYGSGRIKKGQQAGYINDEGYRIIKIDGSAYKSSKLVWFYMTGKWPLQIIDHKDTDRSNDKWNNLRLATQSQNACNKGVNSNNKLRIKGIRFNKGTFEVRIMKEGKTKYFYSKNLEEAIKIRNKIIDKLHGDFSRC